MVSGVRFGAPAAEDRLLRPRAKTKANGAYARAGYPLALRFYSDALEAVTEDESEVAAQLRSNMSQSRTPNPKP